MKKAITLADLPVIVHNYVLDLPEVVALSQDKHRMFVIYFLEDFNATSAAIKAGYKPGPGEGKRVNNSANSQAWRVMQRPEVLVAIQAGYKAIVRRAINRAREGVLNREEILRLDSEIADSNVVDLLETDGKGQLKLKPLAELPIHVQRSIKKVKLTPGGSIDLEMHDKQGAIARLGKHYGLYGGFAIDPQEPSDSEIETDAQMAERAADWLEGISGRLGTTDTKVIVATLRKKRLTERVEPNENV